LKLESFNFYLPPELIAQSPAEKRDNSRLLVYHTNTQKIEDTVFSVLPNVIGRGNLIVFNNTKVIPARMYVNKPTGGKIELLYINHHKDELYNVLIKPSSRIKTGMALTLPGDTGTVTIIERNTELNSFIIRYTPKKDVTMFKVFETYGEMPVPPYIKTKLIDQERYQTVYAESPGAIAAPTAGLHFTRELLGTLKSGDNILANITLHVGIGTFRPVTSEMIESHKMLDEYYSINTNTAEILNTAITQEMNNIIAVGTTVMRTLETYKETGKNEGWTNKYIYPGYKFGITKKIITNFHLPKSTLFILICSITGIDEAQRIYAHAVKQKYRFYSFGDAMIIL